MIRIRAYLDIVFDGLVKKNYDNVIVVMGDEGKGKSHLCLNMLDYWYSKRDGVCTSDHVKHISLDVEQFSEDLKDCVKYDMTVYDEAGDVSGRRAMSNLNTSLAYTYQVIRADNIFTVFVLPSVWDLDSFFRNRRLAGLFYVTARGRCAFWGREKVRRMMSLNERRMVKSPYVVTPDFVDTYPTYKGVMAEPYENKKKAKMKKIRENLHAMLTGEGGSKYSDVYKSKYKKLIQIVYDQFGMTKTLEILKLPKQTLYDNLTRTKSGERGEV